MDGLMAFLARDFYLLVLLAAAAVLVWRYRPRLPALALATVIIGGLAFVLAQIGSRVINSPRPFVVSGGPPLIPSALDNGFPSDHTLLVATAAAVVTVAAWRLGLGFWVLALVVGLARVYARVHHLIDVVGSLACVAAGLGLYLLLARRWPVLAQPWPRRPSDGPSAG